MDSTQRAGFVKKTFRRITSFCNMSWNPLMWCKSAWKIVLNFFREITSGLISSHDSSSRQNAKCHMTPYTEFEEVREERRIQYTSTSTVEKIQNIENRCDQLESDLIREKQLRKAMYEELTKELEELREQEKTPRCENKTDSYIAFSDRDTVPLGDETDGLNRRTGALVKAAPYNRDDLPDGSTFDVPPICSCCLSSSSVHSHALSVSSLKSPKLSRVFAPRFPWELKIGSRVKVLLPSGKVGIGYVCNVGQLPGKVEFLVGVDLETPESCQQIHLVKGHHSFNSKEDRDVFVPFSKVLMAWE